LVSNDSAPVHMAVAMRIPVVAIFGPTLPLFGFAPLGLRDRVVETAGLKCRPCSVHGGRRCPTGTFDCMNQISAVRVRNEVLAIADRDASTSLRTHTGEH
ncbi:MAG TPA: glycosyltransferase family 9 protein, partial [Bacteroidota bacterium]|nr:glycosyltransferase family 9 protein [Bacteroidota bacterium]